MNTENNILTTCKEYLERNPYIGCVCEKLSSDGYMYRYDRNGTSYLFNLLYMKRLKLLILMAHCDVLVPLDKGQLIARYCQAYSDPCRPGILTFDSKFRHVYFKISTPISAENPLTVETLEWMNLNAYKAVSRHRDELDSLASGNWLPGTYQSDEIDASGNPSFPFHNLDLTRTLMRYELQQECRNEVCERISDEEDLLFFNQILTDHGIIHEEIRTDESGCIIFRMRPDYRVRPEMSESIIALCNNNSGNPLPYGLHACSKSGYLWYSSSISLWDGPIGINSIRELEMLGAYTLEKVLETILQQDQYHDNEDILNDPEIQEKLSEVNEAIRKMQFENGEDYDGLFSDFIADDPDDVSMSAGNPSIEDTDDESLFF